MQTWFMACPARSLLKPAGNVPGEIEGPAGVVSAKGFVRVKCLHFCTLFSIIARPTT